MYHGCVQAVKGSFPNGNNMQQSWACQQDLDAKRPCDHMDIYGLTGAILHTWSYMEIAYMEMIPIEWRAMWYYVVFFNMVTNILHGQILQAPVFSKWEWNNPSRSNVASCFKPWWLVYPYTSVHRLDIFLLDLVVSLSGANPHQSNKLNVQVIRPFSGTETTSPHKRHSGFELWWRPGVTQNNSHFAGLAVKAP